MDRSPIEQPTRQRVVFTIARRQVWRHFQKVRFWSGWGLVDVWVAWWRMGSDDRGLDGRRDRCKWRAVIGVSLEVYRINMLEGFRAYEMRAACVDG